MYAFTSHGHQIPEGMEILPVPDARARCGGLQNCRECKRDVSIYYEDLLDQDRRFSMFGHNSKLDIMMALGSRERPMSFREFYEFWASLDVWDQLYYLTVDVRPLWFCKEV